MLLIQISLLFPIVILLCHAESESSIQDQIDRLSRDDQEKILTHLQSTRLARDAPAAADRAENWCCKIDPGVQATSQTRQITFSVTRYGRHKCGYNSCGFAGWSRCTRWCSETWSEMQTRAETYLVYTQRICPNDQVTCCAQHIYVLGHCFSYTEIYNNQQLLAELNALGIVIPGPSVG